MEIRMSSFELGAYFLLQPTFLRAFSASLHLLLLIVMFLSWVLSRTRSQKQSDRKSKLLYSKQAFFSCFGLSIFSLIMCLFNLFSWYKCNNCNWSDEKIVTILDSLLRSLSWLAVACSVFSEPKYPVLLRIWWGFFFSISCYGLTTDYLYYKNNHPLLNQFSLTDLVSAFVGLFLCYTSFSPKNEDGDTQVQEPLLNGSGRELNKPTIGSETITPYSNANILSTLTFSWMWPLMSTGYKKILDLEDIPQLDSNDSVNCSYPILKSKLDYVTKRAGTGVTTFGLVKALVLTAWKDIVSTAILAIVYTTSSYVGPYLINTFVQYLNDPVQLKDKGFLLVLAFSGAMVVECFAEKHWYFKLRQIGVRARGALVAMIYCKGLNLSSLSNQGCTSGEIINIMTVDADRVADFSINMHDPWLLLFEVALAMVILYKNLGLASIAALVATVMVMLANIPLGKLQENFQKKLMKSKDKRMKATSEILRNMRILKLQAWEMKYLSKIVDLRKIENGWLSKFLYTSAMTDFFFWGAPTFMSVVTFSTCMLMGIPLESGKVLSALATFKKLQHPIYNLPDVVSVIAQTKVSLNRISSFLSLQDLKTDVVEKLPRGSTLDMAIEIIDGNFAWDIASLSNLTLKDINVRVSHGMRIAISGTIGSGKSSLLSCILGEMPKVSGTVKLSGSKAYVAQSPWIQSGKIEDNILFGKEMDREKYERVVTACSLKKDLEILPFGDQTVIGERGINLSGGQKQRIQFARALYQDADIYLFDDPFSAVDAHTGSHLFRECIMGILASKTVIYVTHQVEFLPAADLILVMKDGRITQAGKYNDILNAGGDFMELVGAHEKALSELDSIEAKPVSDKSVISDRDHAGEHENRDAQNGQSDDPVGEKGQLVREEEREKGRVGFSVYWKYIRTAYGGALVPFILLAQILFQLLQIGSNYWMAWATPVSESTVPPVEGSTMIIVYVALAIGSSFCVFGRALLLATAGFKTATILFNKMHYSIIRAPMSFFDSTPSGRILNRASADQSVLDLKNAKQISLFIFSLMKLIGTIAVMSQIAWQVILVFIPMIMICIWLQKYYIATARELSRLLGVCKAPIVQHFAETISGLTTIRSFDQESRFQSISMKLINGYSRPEFNNGSAIQWLCFRIDMLSAITFAFSLVFLISVPEGTISPSLAGLVVTYGLTLNTSTTSVIWDLCNMENRIISVERILQYTCISSEPPLTIKSSMNGNNWPSAGEVDICNLQVRYAPHLPLVLRGLTCTFHRGTKTGIVGRTGSGKTTLIQTLFRLVEPAAGEIYIDGVNTSSIGLHDLRSRLSIIPQDPTMFEGTVRSNLDPLEEHTDDEIWESLDKCQLGDEVRKKEGKLDSPVTQNGENWSMGQRQLVCLGRVLLKKSKVLVLDEATASVDTATDNMIQQTLREHFSGSTVITIAHRITSVIDSDMVLLLDNGLIEEYDTPANLLENVSSSFAKLVAEYSMRSNFSVDKIANI